MSRNAQRAELARIALDVMFPTSPSLPDDPMTWPATVHKIADAVLAAGYSKAAILGYAVVDPSYTPLMVNFSSRELAEDYARESGERVNRPFRVVAIVEPPE